MKFKKFALLIVSAVCAACLGIFAAACDNTDNGDDNAATEFSITVYYSDGTTVVDGTKDPYTVQICLADGFCYTEMPTVGADGKVKFDIAKVDAAAINAGESAGLTYEVHVYAEDEFEPSELTQNVTVSKDNATVKAVLKDVAAPAA